MLKNYVLGAEIAKKADFHIANISMLFNDLPLVEGVDFLKYGGITLLNKQSLGYPKYIREAMFRKDITDLSNLFPLTFFKDTLDGNIKLLSDKFKVIKVEGKQFVQITDDKLKEIFIDNKLVKSVVDNSEIDELVDEDYIKGHLRVSNKKSLTWY